MKKKQKINNVILEFCEWILALIIVLNFRTVLTAILSINSIVSIGSFIGILVCSCIILLIDSKKSIKKSEVYLIIFGGAYILFYGIIQGTNRVNYIMMAIILIDFLILLCLCKRNIGMEILEKYSYILVFVAGLSLFFWVFASLLKVIPNTGQTLINWGTLHYIPNYYNVYFETQKINLSLIHQIVIRNTAIFVEAPMASMNFSIAYGVLLLLHRQKNTKKLIVLALAVASTLSTTGYIYVLVISVLKYIYTKKNGIGSIIKYVIIPVALVILSIVISTLLQQKSLERSSLLRQDDFRILLETWNIHPWIGSGINNLDVLYSVMPYWRIQQNLVGIANSITMVWINGGIYLMMIYVIPFIIGIVNSIKNRNYKKLIFIVGFIYLFVITVSPYRYLTLLCLAIFLINRGEETNE